MADPIDPSLLLNRGLHERPIIDLAWTADGDSSGYGATLTEITPLRVWDIVPDAALGVPTVGNEFWGVLYQVLATTDGQPGLDERRIVHSFSGVATAGGLLRVYCLDATTDAFADQENPIRLTIWRR